MDSLSAAIESSFGGRPEAAARPAPSTLHCVAHPAAYLPGAFHLPGIGVPLARNGRSTCSGISVPLAPESVFHLVRCTHGRVLRQEDGSYPPPRRMKCLAGAFGD